MRGGLGYCYDSGWNKMKMGCGWINYNTLLIFIINSGSMRVLCYDDGT